MQVTLTFSAQSADELKKLQVMLSSFSFETAISTKTGDAASTLEKEEPEKKRRTRKTGAADIQSPAKSSLPDAQDYFDFSADEPEEETASVSLEQIRELVHKLDEQGKGDNIRAIMGSFDVRRLGDLAKAQYDKFWKSLKNIK